MPTRSNSGSYDWDLYSVLTSDDNMYESDDNMYDNDNNFEVDWEYSLYAQYNSESGQWEDGNWEFEGDEEDEGHDRGQGEHGDDDSEAVSQAGPEPDPDEDAWQAWVQRFNADEEAWQVCRWRRIVALSIIYNRNNPFSRLLR